MVEVLTMSGAVRRPNDLLVAAEQASAAATQLTAAGLGPVTVARPAFVFEVACAAYDRLAAQVRRA